MYCTPEETLSVLMYLDFLGRSELRGFSHDLASLLVRI